MEETEYKDNEKVLELRKRPVIAVLAHLSLPAWTASDRRVIAEPGFRRAHSRLSNTGKEASEDELPEL